MDKNLRTELQAIKQIQQDIQSNQSAQSRLIQQRSENDMVLKELELASEDAKVYKLIGPTLIKQDPVEAKSNVNKRLEFIQGELSRLDTRLADYQSKAAKRQQQAMTYQQELQKLQQAAATKPAA
ncbi:g5094 [Coccomyxa viridis]|uniref:G5094 protein n=1 Tax=Coccomyxa viridis TaxID=1274662 RepID=A0ABP1FRY6_9CHLO